MSPAPSMTPSIQPIRPSAETAAMPSRQTTKPPFTDREQMVEGLMASTSTAQTTTFETQGNQPTQDFLKKLKKKHCGISDRTTLVGFSDDPADPDLQQHSTAGSLIPNNMEGLPLRKLSRQLCHPNFHPRMSNRDEELEKEIKSELPEQRTMHLMHVCNLFKDIFQIEQNSDFIAHESAPAEQVLAHKAGKIQPNPDDLHFDMWHGPETPWNSVVLNILLQNSWQRKGKHIGTFQTDQQHTIPRCWRKDTSGQKQLGGMDDPREQTQGRKKLKFERWIKTAESMVALKKDAGATEAIIWQWLLDMLKTLGQDGMSSEERDE
ncbi:hypothetical protein K439DRAFT_1620546 [Ramaria rubella]|nr:hypothetical protein K439DRAFT_1620546 [Ramaria rubella]